MSHPDVPVPSGELSTAAAGALRRAVRLHLEPGSPDGDLRRELRLLCDEVYRDDLHAEQLIIRLKHSWQSIPEVQRIAPGAPRNDVLARIVTLCIEEFYARRR